MNTLGVFSTLGDTMHTLGVYHDECGGYHECGGYYEYSGVFSTLGAYHIYILGDTKMLVGVIMSTLRDTMSTPRGVQYTGGIP